jgi:hypothetical protein
VYGHSVAEVQRSAPLCPHLDTAVGLEAIKKAKQQHPDLIVPASLCGFVMKNWDCLDLATFEYLQ